MSDNQTRLGDAGEKIVANRCRSVNMHVEVSVDPYDREKDMLVDGSKVEVKTQVPFIYKDAFTFKTNQLRKCKNADYVFFVSVPCKKKTHHSFGGVYVIKSDKMITENYRTKDGRDMILVPIDQEGMKKLFTMTEEECKILQSYSSSDWN